jgi:hypothetical protein
VDYVKNSRCPPLIVRNKKNGSIVFKPALIGNPVNLMEVQLRGAKLSWNH